MKMVRTGRDRYSLATLLRPSVTRGGISEPNVTKVVDVRE